MLVQDVERFSKRHGELTDKQFLGMLKTISRMNDGYFELITGD